MDAVGKIEQLQNHESEWQQLAELKSSSNKLLVHPIAALHFQGDSKEKIRPGDVRGNLTADLGYNPSKLARSRSMSYLPT